jgi:hypothetical protein
LDRQCNRIGNYESHDEAESRRRDTATTWWRNNSRAANKKRAADYIINSPNLIGLRVGGSLVTQV